MKKGFFKSYFWGFIVLLLLFTGCVNENLYDEKAEEKQVQDFNFSTTQTPMLELDYRVGYSVLFSVYNQNPYQEGTLTVKPGLKPIFSAYTDENGKYSGRITIPAVDNKLYIVSGALCVQNLMEAEVLTNTIKATATYSPFVPENITTKSITSRAGQYGSNSYKILSKWNINGAVDNILKDLQNIPSTTIASLNNVFTNGSPVNKKFFQKTDLVIKEDATVNLYFIDEDAGYYNTLFYYCYDTNTEQNLTTDDIEKRLVVVFPNIKRNDHGGPLKLGQGVSLHYFENGKDLGVKFPAGKSVGWVLGSNGFDRRGGISVLDYFYSNPSLNPEVTGEKNHTAVFIKDKFVILGFEDSSNYSGDGDCNDAVFSVAATPMKAITDGIPDADDKKDPKAVAYTNEYNGTLAFEDNWPKKGDYDMNDVMIKYHSIVSYNYLNEVLSTDDEYKILWSGANYRNGFCYELNTSRDNATIEVLKADYKPEYIKLSPIATKATIILMDDARSATQNNSKVPVYRVKTTFKVPIPVNNAFPEPLYNPFITIQNKVELHLPNFAPSGVFNNESLFGADDDRSIPSEGIYYRSTGFYPFAIDVVGTDELILNDNKYEGSLHAIGNTYPQFVSWVTSKGINNKDWYKNPKK